MDAARIAQVRRFNRVVTQRTGALEQSYLRRGRPLGEARLLFEIGSDGMDLRALRERLGLDSGYVSRLLRSLETQRLVRVQGHARDARRRTATLTAKGQAELAAYERLSDGLAEAMLAPLAPSQRDRLVAAMAEVERLVRAGSVEIRAEPADSAAAQACLAAYFRELAERFDTGFDPARSNAAGVADMTPPHGWFLVAWLDGCPVGCGALKCGPGGIGEVKRMWTAHSARGLGIARRMLAALEAQARTSGLCTLRLETNRTLREAQALYRSAGYQEVARFNDEPYAHHWFEKPVCSSAVVNESRAELPGA